MLYCGNTFSLSLSSYNLCTSSEYVIFQKSLRTTDAAWKIIVCQGIKVTSPYLASHKILRPIQFPKGVENTV